MQPEMSVLARGGLIGAVAPAAELGPAIDDSGIEVRLEPIDGSIAIQADRQLLGEILTNLVANAMVHADHVAVYASRSDDAIEVTIDDDGPGIPSDQREEVFKPFYRLDSSRNPDGGGTGLGLTIARDVMRGHGGDLRLEQAPAGGVRARLRLPV